MILNNLISRGANTSTADENAKTPLHYAVRRNLKGVAAKLLENGALPHTRDKQRVLPLQIAMDNKNDEMCSLLLANMRKKFVRGLFSRHGHQECEFSFHSLLKSELKQTILSVLDCMRQQHGATCEEIRVYYNILESDEHGRTPKDPLFEAAKKSPLQIIAKQGDKAIVHNDTVRLLIRKKWQKYARGRFQFNTFLYMLTLFALTYSSIVAVSTPDPTQYDNPLQVSRAVMEVLSVLISTLTLVTEINQLRRHKLEYFHDVYNWLAFSSACLLLTVIPLRFTHDNAQWHVFAFGYLFWTMRIFKYAVVFRQTGAYTQILFRVLAHDFPQFTMLFLVFLLAFSGSFFLSLRGENDLDTHNETSTFWGILFVGVRTLTEAQPVVDYTGEDGYRVISTIVMVCFLFVCCVILLNLLIAQISDTYQNVQQDAQRELEVHRAWIVARVELNSFFFGTVPLNSFYFGKDYRTAHYDEYEDIKDLKKVLTKWDSPPLKEISNCVHDIWDSLNNHKMNLLTIQNRLTRQEHTLMKMQNQLNILTTGNHEDAEGMKSGLNSPPPTFYRSNSEPSRRVGDKDKHQVSSETQTGDTVIAKKNIHEEVSNTGADTSD